jgi:hypothetical protein
MWSTEGRVIRDIFCDIARGNYCEIFVAAWNLGKKCLLRDFGGFGRTPAYLRIVFITLAKWRARAQKVGAPACNK